MTTRYPPLTRFSFRSYDSGRYTRMNPLLRQFSLKTLTEPLPAPLRASLIRAWAHPRRFDGKQAIPSLHHEHPATAHLPYFPPRLLGIYTHIELEVSRRIVETPKAEIDQNLRTRLLRSQGAYLSALYAALAAQLGEAAALAEFELLLLQVK